MKQNTMLSTTIKWFLAVFFLCFAILPLLCLFQTMLTTDVVSVFAGSPFQKALLNSLTVSLCTTLISLLFGLFLALCISRAVVPLAPLWSMLFVLPMLVPSISLGSGLVMLLGRNGFLTRLLNLPFNIYGFHGIVLGEVLYVTPPVFLMLLNTLTYEDYSPHEAAISLGVPSVFRFFSLTLPCVRKTLISAAFLSFTLSLADYGIPLSVGGKTKTLSTLMYTEVIGKLNFGKGSVIGALLLIPAFAAFLIDLSQQSVSRENFVSRPFPRSKKKNRDIPATLFCTIAGIFVALPFASFLLLTFLEDYPLNMTLTLRHIIEVWQSKGASSLVHSLIISCGAAGLGVLIACTVAWFTARRPSFLSRLLHLAALATMAVPGLALGLAYVLFFKETPLYGTFALLAISGTVHFFASPYLMIYHTLAQCNENLEAVGETLGIPPLRLFLDVLLPPCIPTILEMFSYFFVSTMVTISAVSFLSNASTRPLSLLVTEYSDQLNLEAAAFASLLILTVNLIIRGLSALLRRQFMS